VEVELRRAHGGVIAVEVVGEADATPVLFCHGLADSRLSAHSFAGAAHEFGLRLVAPDRPGIGGTNARRLNRAVDWVAKATLVLDALDVGSVALLGVSGGGAFAAACAAEIPIASEACYLSRHLARLPGLPAGWPPGSARPCRWPRHAPAFSGWYLGRLATVGRREPGLFLRLATSEMPDIDRRALA
jgi:pimeloyl-ACP methyl ester carboxylesterase